MSKVVRNKAEENLLSPLEALASFLPYLLCFTLYFWLSRKLGLDGISGGPDEVMRALLPEAISRGNILPSGYDPEVIYGLGYWSYAFYPQFFAAYVSAVFMALSRAFGCNEGIVFMNGRFASILFGLASLYFFSRTVQRMAARDHEKPELAPLAGKLSVVLLGFWPQFAFLCSYMNNDIAAFCGMTILIDALSSGLSQEWTIGSSVQLGFGVVVSALAYWNVYPFILVSILLFIGSVIAQKDDYKVRAKLICTAALIAAVCVLPFFILNIVRYGDLLGMRTFNMRYQQWLDEGNEALRHPYSNGLWHLLFKSGYVQLTVKSGIAVFGYMAVHVPNWAYAFYIVLCLVGIAVFLAHIDSFREGRWTSILWCAVICACLATIALSLYYTISTDYQPQGRYVIYLLYPLLAGSTLGWASLLSRFASSFSTNPSLAHHILVFLFSGGYALLCFCLFLLSATANGWSGVAL